MGNNCVYFMWQFLPQFFTGSNTCKVSSVKIENKHAVKWSRHNLPIVQKVYLLCVSKTPLYFHIFKIVQIKNN